VNFVFILTLFRKQHHSLKPTLNPIESVQMQSIQITRSAYDFKR